MYYIYTLTLTILILILSFLWIEESRIKNNLFHGIAHKFWVLRENRKYIRFNETLKIKYNSVNNGGAASHNIKGINISRSGLCLLSYEKLKEKSFVDLEIELPRFSKSVTLRGQVIWTKDLRSQDNQGRRLFYIGFKFYKINPKSEAMLLTHLNSIKSGSIQT